MSMHKIPLTELEEVGLTAHMLKSDKPSQLSDAFRSGIAWALKHKETDFKSTEQPTSHVFCVVWINGEPIMDRLVEKNNALIWRKSKIDFGKEDKYFIIS